MKIEKTFSIEVFGISIFRTKRTETKDEEAPPVFTHTSWSRLRKIIKKRDGEICTYCQKHAPNGATDHIMPLSRGGDDSLENLTWSCQSCNSAKQDRTPEEFEMRLTESPDTDTDNIRNTDDAWDDEPPTDGVSKIIRGMVARGMSYNEICAAMGGSKTTALAKIHRAVGKKE